MLIKRPYLLSAAFLLGCLTAAHAQIPVTGKVYELKTHIVLPGVTVKNTSTKDNTLTNTAGIFSIKAKPGDILILTAFSYMPDTVVVTNNRYLEIYLQPANTTLKPVDIKGATSTKLGNLKDTTFHNQTVRYQRDASGAPIGGIALSFGYGKSSKDKRNEKLTYDTLATKAIDKAFSPGNVSKYVPLKGVDLKQFIAIYRPTIKQYKAPNFDLTLYLNDCYKKFKALPPNQRKLASLKADTTDD